jgi:hypothetical protein
MKACSEYDVGLTLCGKVSLASCNEPWCFFKKENILTAIKEAKAATKPALTQVLCEGERRAPCNRHISKGA